MTKTVGIAGIILVTVTATAIAQMPVAAPPPPPRPPSLNRAPPANFFPSASSDPISGIREGVSREAFIYFLLQPVRQNDRAGDGLDQGDIDAIETRENTQARAQAVQRILVHDLDGNLIVTRQEIEAATTTRYNAPSPSGAADRLMRADTNGDGQLTVQEAADSAPRRSGTNPLTALLTLDVDGDRRLTAEELRRLGEKTFASADTDRNGVISSKEAKAVEEKKKDAAKAQQTKLAALENPDCPLPPLPPRASLVLFSTYHANALSPVTIAGPDRETTALNVEITPGLQSLYVILVSRDPVIWRLSGSAERVAHLVIGGDSEEGGVVAAGVTGIDKNSVTFLPSSCLSAFSQLNESGDLIRKITRITGKAPSSVLSSRSTGRIVLAQQRFFKKELSLTQKPLPPAGFDPAVWNKALQYWPDGLAEIAPSSVLASTRAQKYVVLPSQAGLAQMIGTGAMRYDAATDKYRFLRPIPRLPGGMTGPHRVDLLLPSGMPLPRGNLGQSCLMEEKTGRILGPAANCEKPGSKSEALDALPPPIFVH